MFADFTELQQNLQNLQGLLQEDGSTDGLAIAQGLILCQDFEAHQHRYLPQPLLLETAASRLGQSVATHTTLDRPIAADFNQVKNPVKNPVELQNVKNAAETENAERACGTVCESHASTAPEEHMLSHRVTQYMAQYVEFSRHMRLLGADFSTFRAARNPSTQKNRRLQLQKRLEILLAYSKVLGPALSELGATERGTAG